MVITSSLTILWRLRILSTALVVPPLLRLMSLERLAGRLGRRASIKTPSASQQRAITARVEHVLRRLPEPWNQTCLTRSLVLYHLLRRSGIPLDLCIGVRREAGSMEAHAWLEREGKLYLEGEGASAFEEIARFPR